jgi:hypothetical protein
MEKIKMQAIEFETQTHNGTIELPPQFQPWKDCFVKVIVLIEENDIATTDHYAFDAVTLNTKGFHFNREEANER